ncbi:hypothetical protein ABKY54_004543 [Vibrio harveyi]
MVEFREITEMDIKRLCADARPEDVAEVAASTIKDFESAVRQSVADSEWSLCAFCGDDLLCVFGIGNINILSGTGAPWLLGTNKIKAHKKAFWKGSVEVVEWMKERIDTLENHVHARNKPSIAWLKRLGFTVESSAIDGLNGEKFLRFYLCVQ